mmetsp:Transcript_62401/g.129034  ORF Transcript_62401/g.129034 Transcript_62401/m.129034 type:complete len:87 (+) Transcript_62401:44-304(+)
MCHALGTTPDGSRWSHAAGTRTAGCKGSCADVVAYNAAIKACAKSASWTKALRLLSTLKTMPGEISRVLHAVNTMSSGVEKFQHDG